MRGGSDFLQKKISFSWQLPLRPSHRFEPEFYRK